MTDLETRLRDTFVRVANSEPVSTLPDDVAEQAGRCRPASLAELLPNSAKLRTVRREKRRRARVAIAALAIIGGGLSLGAAAGLPTLPHSVVQALGWTRVPGAYNADPATTRILLTERGPNGQIWRLWGAVANDNGYCVTLTSDLDLDPTTGHPALGSSNDDDRGIEAGSCGDIVGSTYWNTFGGEPTESWGPTGPDVFIVRVPGATSVHIEFDGGKTRSLPIGGGYTAGWLTQSETHLHPMLVGLDGHGAVIGRTRLPFH